MEHADRGSNPCHPPFPKQVPSPYWQVQTGETESKATTGKRVWRINALEGPERWPQELACSPDPQPQGGGAGADDSAALSALCPSPGAGEAPLGERKMLVAQAGTGRGTPHSRARVMTLRRMGLGALPGQGLAGLPACVTAQPG